MAAEEAWAGELNRLAFGAGITLTHLSARRSSLEEAFFELTGTATGQGDPQSHRCVVCGGRSCGLRWTMCGGRPGVPRGSLSEVAEARRSLLRSGSQGWSVLLFGGCWSRPAGSVLESHLVDAVVGRAVVRAALPGALDDHSLIDV